MFGQRLRIVKYGTMLPVSDNGIRRRRLDEVDRRLLSLLRSDARRTNAALARDVGMTAPAVADRLRRLEREGVITGYRVGLDAEALGYGFPVFLAVTLEHHGMETVQAFVDAIAKLPEVVEIHQVTGGPDFFVKVVARDVDSYRELLMRQLAEVPGIDRVHSHIVLDTLKDDEPEPLDGP